jgi:hypothetical protein
MAAFPDAKLMLHGGFAEQAKPPLTWEHPKEKKKRGAGW